MTIPTGRRLRYGAQSEGKICQEKDSIIYSLVPAVLIRDRVHVDIWHIGLHSLTSTYVYVIIADVALDESEMKEDTGPPGTGQPVTVKLLVLD